MIAPIPIAVPAHTRPMWARLALPQGVDPGAGERFPGLRIVDDRGESVPYVLDPPGFAPALARLHYQSARGLAAVSEPRSTVITFDLGTPHTQVSSLRFETARREFSREVSVSTSEDGEAWEFAGSGRIARFADGTRRLAVPIDESAARYVRLKIFDGDDAPLARLSVAIYGPRRSVAFVALSGRAYGIACVLATRVPTYDLAEQLAHDRPQSFLDAETPRVRPAAHGPPGRPARPWPFLEIAFAGAILVLGWVTLANLRNA